MATSIFECILLKMMCKKQVATGFAQGNVKVRCLETGFIRGHGPLLHEGRHVTLRTVGAGHAREMETVRFLRPAII
jgi:hypothetical protein